MINYGGKEITDIYYGSKKINEIWYGKHKIYPEANEPYYIEAGTYNGYFANQSDDGDTELKRKMFGLMFINNWKTSTTIYDFSPADYCMTIGTATLYTPSGTTIETPFRVRGIYIGDTDLTLITVFEEFIRSEIYYDDTSSYYYFSVNVPKRIKVIGNYYEYDSSLAGVTAKSTLGTYYASNAMDVTITPPTCRTAKLYNKYLLSGGFTYAIPKLADWGTRYLINNWVYYLAQPLSSSTSGTFTLLKFYNGAELQLELNNNSLYPSLSQFAIFIPANGNSNKITSNMSVTWSVEPFDAGKITASKSTSTSIMLETTYTKTGRQGGLRVTANGYETFLPIYVTDPILPISRVDIKVSSGESDIITANESVTWVCTADASYEIKERKRVQIVCNEESIGLKGYLIATTDAGQSMTVPIYVTE